MRPISEPRRTLPAYHPVPVRDAHPTSGVPLRQAAPRRLPPVPAPRADRETHRLLAGHWLVLPETPDERDLTAEQACQAFAAHHRIPAEWDRLQLAKVHVGEGDYGVVRGSAPMRLVRCAVDPMTGEPAPVWVRLLPPSMAGSAPRAPSHDDESSVDDATGRNDTTSRKTLHGQGSESANSPSHAACTRSSSPPPAPDGLSTTPPSDAEAQQLTDARREHPVAAATAGGAANATSPTAQAQQRHRRRRRRRGSRAQSAGASAQLRPRDPVGFSAIVRDIVSIATESDQSRMPDCDAEMVLREIERQCAGSLDAPDTRHVHWLSAAVAAIGTAWERVTQDGANCTELPAGVTALVDGVLASAACVNEPSTCAAQMTIALASIIGTIAARMQYALAPHFQPHPLRSQHTSALLQRVKSVLSDAVHCTADSRSVDASTQLLLCAVAVADPQFNRGQVSAALDPRTLGPDAFAAAVEASIEEVAKADTDWWCDAAPGIAAAHEMYEDVSGRPGFRLFACAGAWIEQVARVFCAPMYDPGSTSRHERLHLDLESALVSPVPPHGDQCAVAAHAVHVACMVLAAADFGCHCYRSNQAFHHTAQRVTALFADALDLVLACGPGESSVTQSGVNAPQPPLTPHVIACYTLSAVLNVATAVAWCQSQAAMLDCRRWKKRLSEELSKLNVPICEADSTCKKKIRSAANTLSKAAM